MYNEGCTQNLDYGAFQIWNDGDSRNDDADGI